MMNVIT